MRFVWERKWIVTITVVVFFSAVMAVRQIERNRSHHAELREAFLFLHRAGHRSEAEKLYGRLLWNLKDEPTRHLIDDIERTSVLVPTNQSPATNILVRYHLTVQRELDKRFTEQYLVARELAEGKK